MSCFVLVCSLLSMSIEDKAELSLSGSSLDIIEEGSDVERDFGKLLSILRQEADKTQLQLASAISYLGYPLDASALSRYENGSRRPEAEFIPYFSRALRLSESSEKTLLEAYITVYKVLALQSYLKGKENVRKINE